MTHKPTLLVDFDGVIHRYSGGWKDGSTYDSPIPGAKEALDQLEDEGYNVVIFSTRDADQILAYLRFWDFKDHYTITNEKLPAVAIIDDRGIRFQNWGRALNDIHKFAPTEAEKAIQAEVDRIKKDQPYRLPTEIRREVLQSRKEASDENAPNKENN